MLGAGREFQGLTATKRMKTRLYPVARFQLLHEVLQAAGMHVRRRDGCIVANGLRPILVGIVRMTQTSRVSWSNVCLMLHEQDVISPCSWPHGILEITLKQPSCFKRHTILTCIKQHLSVHSSRHNRGGQAGNSSADPEQRGPCRQMPSLQPGVCP